MSTKILFITADRVKASYGVTSGLYNSATFVVNFLNRNGFDAALTSVQDSNEIDKAVTQNNPDVVIIEAIWVPPYKFEELLKIPRHMNRRWIVRIHSKAPFLANEGIATRWIREYTQIQNGKIQIAPNTQELTEQLHVAFPDGTFIFLPNVYQFKKFDRIPPEEDGEDWINIGCFGAIRPMKNTYQQALACIDFAERNGKRLKFHVNSTRVEQSGDNVLKNLKSLFVGSPHRLVHHGWYQHTPFLQAISQMDLGTQVSFSESFNIVTADFVNAKIPIIASEDIEWMPPFLRTSPTSHKGMVRKLQLAYRFRKISAWFQTVYLKIYNYRAELTWLAALK